MFKKNDKAEGELLGILVVFLVIGLLVAAMAGYPMYKIWSKDKAGQAELAEAEWTKKISIEEAKAKLESSKFEKETEIIRAEGIAEANRIISGSITPEYIQYKFVEGLNDGSTEVIYVPTEANIPILEAGRSMKTTSAEA